MFSIGVFLDTKGTLESL